MATTTVREGASQIRTKLTTKPLSASDDIKNVDLSQIHHLSGPIAVEGAEPGDCLVVDILDGQFTMQFLFLILLSHVKFTVQPFPEMPWGYTVSIASKRLLSSY